MVDFGNRRSYSNPKPFTLTCVQVKKILREKIDHPKKEVKGLGEAIFHFALCEVCKQQNDLLRFTES